MNTHPFANKFKILVRLAKLAFGAKHEDETQLKTSPPDRYMPVAELNSQSQIGNHKFDGGGVAVRGLADAANRW